MVKPAVRFLLGIFFIFLIKPIYTGRPAQWLTYKKGDFLFDFKVDQKTESFYLKNINFLSGNPCDQMFYAQGTWDFTTHTRFGDYLNSKITLRNKARWGTTRGIVLTTQRSLSFADVTIDEHQHGINLLVPWIRKAWVKVCLNNALDIDRNSRHYLKVGAFPYKVGRGISFGEAYAFTPGVLGFFDDNTIDQYAFGALLHGDLTKEHHISYDVYGALLENLSNSLWQTTEPVYDKCTECRSRLRGYGVIQWALIGRLLFTFFKDKTYGSLTTEPYVVYYRYPGQKAEFASSADVKLGTFGFATEYSGPKFELGFELAANAGRQDVLAWDRNKIIAQRETSTGYLKEVYNNIYVGKKGTEGAYQAPYTNTNKTIVDQSVAGTQFNDQEIASTGLYNSPSRFRPHYRNKFGGFMFVADALYWLKPHTLKIAATVGYASGDEQPNTVINRPEDIEINSTYSGFIPLQEIYSGKRVRSVFITGSQPLVRPFTVPATTVDSSRQKWAATASGFTNLIYTGAGLTWTPQGLKRVVKVNPNIFYYWQAMASKAYYLSTVESATACPGVADAGPSHSLDWNASRALGLEANLFLEAHLLDNFRLILATALFFPGTHYNQVIGAPTNKQQYDEVTSTNRYCINNNAYPLLNKKPAYVMNFGFEYLF